MIAVEQPSRGIFPNAPSSPRWETMQLILFSSTQLFLVSFFLFFLSFSFFFFLHPDGKQCSSFFFFNSTIPRILLSLYFSFFLGFFATNSFFFIFVSFTLFFKVPPLSWSHLGILMHHLFLFSHTLFKFFSSWPYSYLLSNGQGALDHPLICFLLSDSQQLIFVLHQTVIYTPGWSFSTSLGLVFFLCIPRIQKKKDRDKKNRTPI